MVHIHVQRTIAASPERVFDWLADPANLAAAPLALEAGYAKNSPGPGEGAMREVTWVGTHVDWVTSYTHPARWGGKISEAVIAGCAKALEK